MNTVERFVNVGKVVVDVFKSDNDYRFHLQESNEDVSHVAEVIEDTLKIF